MLKNKIKILLVLIITFLFAEFIGKNIFIASTPKFNRFFAQNLIAKVNDVVSKINIRGKNSQIANQNNNINLSTISSPINKEQLSQEVANVINGSMQKITTGVYAGERDNVKVYQFKTNEINWKEYTFVVNGNKIIIRVPEGQDPPKQTDFE